MSTEPSATIETGSAKQRAYDSLDRALAEGGDASALIRAIDWDKTPLGPMESWSNAMRSTVALLLHNHWGMLLWWGPELIQIYNDAYRPVLADKHPRAMGQPVSECWSEIWHIIGPMIERPYRGGPASTSDDLMLGLRRKSFLEEAHFRVAYSPVPDPTVQPTGIGGVLATVTETTEQVFGERQLRTLRALSERSAAMTGSVDEACQAATETLGSDPWDVPFALFYVLDPEGQSAQLVSSTGVDAASLPAVAPSRVELSADDVATTLWPLRQAAFDKQVVIVEDLAARMSALPVSPWGERPRSAIVLPLASPEQPRAQGLLVCGISPHRVLDAGYRTFFELAAAQILTAVRNARALEAERKRLETLAALDRAKTTFFSNISHEFRTPLTLMLGPTQDLLAGAHGRLSEPQRQQLDLIHRNEVRLHKLVNALLDFARIEAGRIEASYEVTDLATLTRDLAGTFRAAIESAGLRFEVDCPALDAPVYVDRSMWEKIVLNLLSNAFKFTFDGSIVVSLRAQDGHVALRVADSGVGIPKQALPRLFERFHRMEGTRSRTHEGSGIGLALVDELVKLHGGTVYAESEPDVGSMFAVVIPQGSDHLPQEHIRPATRASVAPTINAFVEEALRWLPGSRVPSSTDPALHGPLTPQAQGALLQRVLLADDNTDMRDYVRRVLEPYCVVDDVEDGDKALEHARAHPPDVIVTDVMMPGLDGFALLKALRAHPETAQVPVIMLTARAGEESRIEGLTAGADDYLVKPFSARELVARVRLHLDNVRDRRAAEAEHDRQLADAERTVRFSESLLGVLGHDLRNPLHAIATAASLLAARADSEQIAYPAKRITASVRRMDRMIWQLLDFTSIRLGRGLPLARTRVDLDAECEAMVQELQPVFRRPVDMEASGDTVGAWDRDRISQLLSNLIANACQHGTPGQPVKVRIDGSSPTLVRVEVCNDGAIVAELLPSIFAPMRASGGKGQRGSSGLGLGLYITQQIVIAHGGHISVASHPAQGTTFTVELPRHAPTIAERVFSPLSDQGH